MSYSRDPRQTAALARVARALADPTRLDVLRTIATRDECCCGDIARGLAVTPATVTHHLRILTEAGLVASRREGQFIRLQPDADALDTFCRGLASLTAPGPRAVEPDAPARPASAPRRRTGRGQGQRTGDETRRP
ncbi:MAG: helix-turn-helix domain-containing protein [Vicinamibacteraceae bacterium]|nr:helix-turn-helix domain-containing protein [Vicinamibacteraceae bacterium]